ncbi:MAG: ABC transporter permease [Panacagrimonas sp.]
MASATSPTCIARRALRQPPELWILAASVVIAVAASSAVSLFSDRVWQVLNDQTSQAFGADAAMRSRDPFAPELLASIDALGIEQAALIQFPTVVLHGEETALVSIKAVDAAYPLRGHLRRAAAPFGKQTQVSHGPAPGAVWVDLRLWQNLQLALGDTLELGRSKMRVSALLTHEPDRNGSFGDLAPRVLMNRQDLMATELIAPGARVEYGRLLSGTAAQIAQARELAEAAGLRFQTPQDARPALGNSVSRAEQFLKLAVLATLLLSGAAIASAAHQHGQGLRDEAALLRALGASTQRIASQSLKRLLTLALSAGVVGVLCGFAAQGLLAGAAAGLMNTELPAPRAAVALTSVGYALLLVLGFAAPPWLAARNTPPIRVFQRNVPVAGSRLASGIAAISALLLIALHTQDAQLAGLVLLGALGCCSVLAVIALILIRLLSPLRHGPSSAIRFGLANIARRRLQSVAQAVALGLALLALLLVAIVRSELLDNWRKALPPETPNQFLINVQHHQLPALRVFFAERGYTDLKFWPMARARLVALNGEAVTADSFDDPQTRRWINREFNISWTQEFGDDNRLLDGQWWPAETDGKPWLSVDEYAVERLGLKLGDRLSLQIVDRTIEFEVYNLREVSWDSFRPNFFLVAAPGVIDDGAAQWITSFHLPPDQRALLPDLIRTFPNITALDLEAAMQQVRRIMDQVVAALEFVLLFTLGAGLTVLMASIEATRADRVRETALLRALGAGRGTVMLGVISEYACLGLIAGIVAAASAQLLGFLLAREVFELSYQFSPRLWLTGSLGGALLVSGLGWLSLRRSMRTSARQVLARTA